MNANDLPTTAPESAEDCAFEERLYQAYCRDRGGSLITEPLSHAQIVADGVYGARVEAFALRYSLEQSAYLDACIQSDKLRRAGCFTPSDLADDARRLDRERGVA